MTGDVPFRRPGRLFPFEDIELVDVRSEEKTMQERLARELHRIPGLYRRFELALILEPGADYRIENAGETSDGCPLLAVYRCAAGPGS